jgi:hypothetical protein
MIANQQSRIESVSIEPAPSRWRDGYQSNGGWEIGVSQISTPQDGLGRPRRRDNGRATVRYRCAPATIGRLHVANDHEFQHAWVLNLSQSGIGFFLSRPVAAGMPVVIQMRATESGEAVDLCATVVHCTAQLTGEWLLGCEFIQPLPVEILDSLL